MGERAVKIHGFDGGYLRIRDDDRAGTALLEMGHGKSDPSIALRICVDPRKMAEERDAWKGRHDALMASSRTLQERCDLRESERDGFCAQLTEMRRDRDGFVDRATRAERDAVRLRADLREGAQALHGDIINAQARAVASDDARKTAEAELDALQEEKREGWERWATEENERLRVECDEVLASTAEMRAERDAALNDLATAKKRTSDLSYQLAQPDVVEDPPVAPRSQNESPAAWLAMRIERTRVLIVAYEDAISSGGASVRAYSLDTGKTRQEITNASLAEMRDMLKFLEDRLIKLERRAAEGLGVSREAALNILHKHGDTNEPHHMEWVIDQVVRALTGDGYAAWVAKAKAGEDGPNSYGWNEGIAP